MKKVKTTIKNTKFKPTAVELTEITCGIDKGYFMDVCYKNHWRQIELTKEQYGLIMEDHKCKRKSKI